MTSFIFHSLLSEYVLFLQHGEPQLKEAYCKVGPQQNLSLFDPEIIFSYSILYIRFNARSILYRWNST